MDSDTSACVSTELGPAEWLKNTSGVLQGDTLSPWLFIVLFIIILLLLLLFYLYVDRDRVYIFMSCRATLIILLSGFSFNTCKRTLIISGKVKEEQQ